MSTTHAFVFARGGSKGLPGKNIRPLGGIPLLGRSILVARAVETIAEIFVSTDDADIARVAREFGAQVIDRPAALAGDATPEWLAWQHAVRHVQAASGDFDCFVSLPATSPLRAAVDVRACLAALDERTDAVVCVTPAARSPYFNMVRRASDGGTEVLLRSDAVRRQDAGDDVFDLTTVAYASRPAFILAHGGLFQGRVRSVVVPRERAVDIDDLHDFIVAEALHRHACGDGSAE
jgi:N-acylneuraminate cytidylyltransferase